MVLFCKYSFSVVKLYIFIFFLNEKTTYTYVSLTLKIILNDKLSRIGMIYAFLF